MSEKSMVGCCVAAAALLVLAGFVPAVRAEAGSASGPAMSELNPNRPAPDGLLAPTLEGDWRFRVTVAPWLPDTLVIDASAAGGSGQIEEDLKWILKALYFYVPLDFELRKGRFGAYYRNFLVFLQPDNNIKVFGPITMDWDVKLMMFDVGLTYELGRWRLGEEQGAPELTLEPYFGARIVHLPIDIRVGGSSVSEALGSQVPVVGMRAFVDLTKRWNLEFVGDYGGFGVDDNHQTYQGAAYLGYRWPALGAHWNLQVGYRAMRLFEMRQANTDISMDLRGAQIVFGFEF